jgi:hypothetical protein
MYQQIEELTAKNAKNRQANLKFLFSYLDYTLSALGVLGGSSFSLMQER